MKRLLQLVFACSIVASMLLSGIAVNAAGLDSEVTVDSTHFVTVPGDDLFQNFKNLVPGAQVDQLININNTSGYALRLYLRTEAVAETNQELLDILELTLTLTKPDGTQSVIYSGQASGTSEGANIPLGSYQNNQSGKITAALKVPVTMGNEFQGAIAKVKWVFSCEEIVTENHNGDGGDDKDETDIWGSLVKLADNGVPLVSIADDTKVPLANLPNSGGFPVGSLMLGGAALVAGGIIWRKDSK